MGVETEASRYYRNRYSSVCCSCSPKPGPGQCSTRDVSSDSTSAATLLSLLPNFSPLRNELPSPRRGSTEGQKAPRAAACRAHDPQGMGS